MTKQGKSISGHWTPFAATFKEGPVFWRKEQNCIKIKRSEKIFELKFWNVDDFEIESCRNNILTENSALDEKIWIERTSRSRCLVGRSSESFILMFESFNSLLKRPLRQLLSLKSPKVFPLKAGIWLWLWKKSPGYDSRYFNTILNSAFAKAWNDNNSLKKPDSNPKSKKCILTHRKDPV